MLTNERLDALRQSIMNIGCQTQEHAYGAYSRGHRDARHAAAELVAEFVATSPGWHDRPTGPGRWLCVGDENHPASKGTLSTLDLDQGDLGRGAPFYTIRVFGPIPSDEGE